MSRKRREGDREPSPVSQLGYVVESLYRLRVKWPIINEKYLDQLFASLKAIGFFDLMTDK